mmetsp:Transcript_15189/g.29154  ORF Transcript_15189/g.29154 Transcript_15189/m.29154 type:complete len:205 (-) Transcript_15189:513-1127(-)
MLPVYVPRDCSLEVLGIAMRSPSSHPGARRGSTSCGVRGERRACGLGLCTPLASTDLIWASRSACELVLMSNVFFRSSITSGGSLLRRSSARIWKASTAVLHSAVKGSGVLSSTADSPSSWPGPRTPTSSTEGTCVLMHTPCCARASWWAAIASLEYSRGGPYTRGNTSTSLRTWGLCSKGSCVGASVERGGEACLCITCLEPA